jgi:hypothetical protein
MALRRSLRSIVSSDDHTDPWILARPSAVVILLQNMELAGMLSVHFTGGHIESMLTEHPTLETMAVRIHTTHATWTANRQFVSRSKQGSFCIGLSHGP